MEICGESVRFASRNIRELGCTLLAATRDRLVRGKWPAPETVWIHDGLWRGGSRTRALGLSR